MPPVVQGDAEQEQERRPDARLEHHLADAVGHGPERSRPRPVGPPGSTRATPRAWPRKNRAQVVTMNGVGVGRERQIPPHQPGHHRRDDAADDQQTDARHTRPEEEERGDPDQRGIESVNPGGQLRLVELQDPGGRRADRRADDRIRPPSAASSPRSRARSRRPSGRSPERRPARCLAIPGESEREWNHPATKTWGLNSDAERWGPMGS